MKQHRKILCTLFLCMIAISLLANKPYIINFTKKHYQAANKNWNIREDELGIVYIANDKGLLQFDGLEWRLSEMEKKTPIKSIYIIDHNLIYTGGYQDFGFWERGVSGELSYTSLSSQLDEKDLKDHEFWQIWSVDNNKTIYFQSFYAIYMYSDGKVTKVDAPALTLFLLKVKDELWVQEMQGELYKVQGNKCVRIAGSEVFNNTDVRVILPYMEDQLLIGTSGKGLYLYKNGRFTEWDTEISKELEITELNTSVLTPHNTYLFGTISSGLYEANANGKILSHYSTGNMLQTNAILGLYQNQNGQVWMALDRGISFIPSLSNISYYASHMDDIGSVYDAKLWDNKLFLSTNQGLYYVSTAPFDFKHKMDQLKLIDGTQGQNWSLEIVGDKLYCNHNKGIKVIGKNLSVTDHPQLRKGVYSSSMDKLYGKDILLASTYDRATIVTDDKQTIHIGQPNIQVEYSLIDHMGNIWMKRPFKGVYKYRLSKDMLSVRDSIYIESKPDSNMSMFKLGGRIVLVDDKTFFSFDEIENKISPNTVLNSCFRSIENIRKIVPIKENMYWAVTTNAIYKFFFDGAEATILDSYSTDIDNLSLVERYENITVLNDSLDLVCLDNGFLIYNHNMPSKEFNIQSPVIASIASQNRSGEAQYIAYNANEIATISNTFNSLTIKFFTKNTLSRNLRFEYKMEGIDIDWLTSKDNKISYDRLPKGSYRLQLRTVDRLENTSTITHFDFEILAPWYQTAWAFLLYIVLILAIFYMVWSLVLKRYRNIHLQKIRSREAKRLRILNGRLEQQVKDVNSELFTQTSLILQKNKLLREMKDVLDTNETSSKGLSNTVNKRLTHIIDSGLNDEDNWEMFLISFEQKHPLFLNNLKTRCSRLTPNDLKLCVCLRLNLDSKEIAAMMSLSVRTVENNRSRLRKKLDIPASMHLTDFLLSIG